MVNNTKILMTSRSEHDIKSELEEWLENNLMLEIRGVFLDEDIKAFVQACVYDGNGQLKRWRRRPDVQQKIAAHLIEKADSM